MAGAIYTDDLIIVCGAAGTNTAACYALSLTTYRWRLLPEPPAGVCDGCTVSIVGTKLYVLGSVSPIVYILHLDTQVWTESSTCGESPLPRIGHATCVHEQRIYLFGGCNGFQYEALFYLETDAMQWAQIPFYARDHWPPNRGGATLVLQEAVSADVQPALVLHGGESVSDEGFVLYGDTWFFTL
eukprot:TRINITY_DN990_c0_g1_i3.p1 TRINITY_DN990_c0_g1~~TRINITY_DN990_c0_g1_i3.p1  ORF type:complete len:185 (+),score=35.20 TRINITY_DN990_c0_g1_i3:489-1043(+)